MGHDALAQVARRVGRPVGERKRRAAAGGFDGVGKEVRRRDDEDAVVAASVDDLPPVGLPVGVEHDVVRVGDEHRASRVRDADGRGREHDVGTAADAVLVMPARVAGQEVELAQPEEPALEDHSRRLSHACLYDGRAGVSWRPARAPIGGRGARTPAPAPRRAPPTAGATRGARRAGEARRPCGRP